MAHEVLSGGSVNQWNASYYDNTNKRWIYGVLHLLPSALLFESKNIESKNDPDNPMELFIKFCFISSVKKASSSMLYPSITVTTTNKEILWFSSFRHRDSVALVIQHFFQSFLLTGNSTDDRKDQNSFQSMSSQAPKSKMGVELLKNVNDSHETLKTAASKLVSQGGQLQNASGTMVEIHENVGVADRFIHGIDSWFGRWKTPRLHTHENLHVVSDKDIPYGFHFDAICSEIHGFRHGLPKECVLRLMQDGITILDNKQKTVHHFSWSDVSRLRVASPWEIVISQFMIGKADISYTLTSVEMPKIIEELEKLIPQKMEYMNHSNNTSPCTNSNVRQTDCQALTPASSAGRTQREALFQVQQNSQPFSDECDGGPPSQMQNGNMVTDEEMNQLSSALSNLKSLALDIQKEEDKQLETLDQLTESVNKGNDELTNVNSKLKILLK